MASANKILRTYNNFSQDNKKPFTELETKSLLQLSLEIAATAEINNEDPPKGYRYTATITNPLLNGLRSNALAGIGLRYEPGSIFPANPADPNRRQDFNTTTKPEGFTIPLATSVEYNVNGRLGDFSPNTNANVLNYIGFNPSTSATGSSDDALTVDGSFYQLPDAIFKSTLDSRSLTLAALQGNANFTAFPQSIALKRSFQVSDATTPNLTPGANPDSRTDLLPAYEVRSMKIENTGLVDREVKPVMDAMLVNAYVYAQEGSWLVIPGDYFRSNPPVRGIADQNGLLAGSYIDYNNDGKPDPGEYILSTPGNQNSTKVADLNRNGTADAGEKEAALRFVRYNSAPIQFYGAIVENQTAVVADVTDSTAGNPPIVKGAVQDWMDKWATYNDSGGKQVGAKSQFSFINYSYDSSLANETPQANQLRVPLTDGLLYQE